jgi:hypothetical protein
MPDECTYTSPRRPPAIVIKNLKGNKRQATQPLSSHASGVGLSVHRSHHAYIVPKQEFCAEMRGIVSLRNSFAQYAKLNGYCTRNNHNAYY